MQNSEDIQLGDQLGYVEQRCGLMQNSEDIQPCFQEYLQKYSCGLMQNSEDIQLSRLPKPLKS